MNADHSDTTSALWTLRLGDRVRLSNCGAEQFPNQKARRGKIASTSREGYPKVLWDGLKTASVYHPSLVESANDEPLPPDLVYRFAHVEITDD